MPPVYRNQMTDKYKWADRGETVSNFILVWHIATSMCEIEIYVKPKAQHCWWLSPFFWIKDWWSHGPFLVNLKNLKGELRDAYISATSLSRYCAYLLIFVPQLLPDNQIVPELVFDKTVSNARDVLQGCDSLESVYEKLSEIGEEIGEKLSQGEVPEGCVPEGKVQEVDMTILERGAMLGRTLINEMDAEERWKLLAEFWAVLLIYIAPTIYMDQHMDRIVKGGEFITLIWILFAHGGISERSEGGEGETEIEGEREGEGRGGSEDHETRFDGQQGPANEEQ
ncbi:hypothetical protein LUZ60_007093 [Juncus effusus]|nr:hypothetical protein LUZ60_007093 [Juncus effusus]